MGAPAVGLAFNQSWASTRAGSLHGGVSGLIDGEDIIAVHDHARDAVAGSACRHVAQRMGCGGRSLCGPHIVLAYVDHGQLPGRGDVETFMERTRIRGSVATERDSHSPLSVHLRGKTHPC